MKISSKSYWLLPVYKSVLFRFCKFETDSKDEQDIIIVNALNIKKRKERVTYIYDSLCKYIDDFYKKENICGFKNGQCYVQRKEKSNLKNGCCRLCMYVNDKGCTTSNLSCKLFVCKEVCCRRKVLRYSDIKVFKVFSIKQKIVVKSDFFSSREEVLKDLYCYGIIHSTIRIVVRLIRTLIHSKNKK